MLKILLTNSKQRHTPKRNEVHISDHKCISVRNVNYDHKLHLSGKIAVFYHQLGVETFEQDVLVCKYKW